MIKLKGKVLGGTYGKYLSSYHHNNSLIFHAPENIYWHDKNWEGQGFWRLEWYELPNGDDVLCLYEQETPTPLEFEECPPLSSQKYIVKASSYSSSNSLIKNVFGYGAVPNEELLYSIVIQLENNFVHIIAGPVIEMKILDKHPELSHYDRLLFTTGNE
ncbi:hypothetical protein ACERII_00480 [Evansella sp. AB-rgal1]|uniref:hypothetical protein n=1 Tax=Evansella sp. AB-rgal1 TaxID=3242696 RepID=UPI00359DC4DA